jgi:hypothetical protein
MSKRNAERIPHSWGVEDWPAIVYPGRPSRARYLIRMHRNELTTCGALTRIGRDLVVMGAGYSAWLAKQSNRVDMFAIAPNNTDDVAA